MKKFVISLLLLSLCVTVYAYNVSSKPIKENKSRTVVRLNPDDETGYNFYGYIYIPKEINTDINRLLVTVYKLEDYQLYDHTEKMVKYIESDLKRVNHCDASEFCDNGIPSLALIIPCTVRDLAPGCLSSITLKAEGEYKDIDIQVTKMIQDTLSYINDTCGVELEEKVIIHGSSSNGWFASRFALLQPQIIHMVLCGVSGGLYPCPAEEYKGIKLIFPFGTADFEELTGRKFDYDSWKQIHFLCFEGEYDTDRGFIAPNGYAGEKTPAKLMNMSKTERMKFSADIYNSFTSNFQFILYKNRGHVTNYSDLLFFINHNNSEEFNPIRFSTWEMKEYYISQ